MAVSESSSSQDSITLHRIPHRFRRRLRWFLLCAGLVPLAAWGSIGNYLLRQGLKVAPPIDPLLQRISVASFATAHPDLQLADDIRQTRLHLAQADLARRTLQNRIPIYFGGALAISAVALLALAYGLGRRVARPIETLTGGIQQFAKGDLRYQIASTGQGDELDFAIVQFNLMGQKLLAQHERLRDTEQLAAWQDIARAMAHDLKNPLTAMKMALARLARPQATAEARHEATSLLSEEIDRLLRMTQSFSAYARLPAPIRKPMPIVPLLEEVAGLYQDMKVPVQVNPKAHPTIVGDGDLLRRAFGNLVKNAIEASEPGDSPVLIRVDADTSYIHIEIVDQGTGISAAILGGALTRSLGSTKIGGSGLGLPVAYKIIFEHGGNLRLVPGHPRGTQAIVTLPLPVTDVTI